MEVLLISNNLYENRISFSDKNNLELKMMTRPLSVAGEREAKNLAVNENIEDTNLIFSSGYSGAIATAKYLADRTNKNISIDEGLNDQKIGEVQNHSLKSIKFMQDHDFDIKNVNGESLNELSNRITRTVTKIINANPSHKIAIFTHKRAILAFLLKQGNVGYNLDDELVIEYNDKVLYDSVNRDFNIIKLTVDDRKITNIEVLDI